MSASPTKLRVPAVFHHQASGQSAVCVRDANGKRRMVYLGPHGSPDAARRYREVLAEHLAGRPVVTASRAVQQAGGWPTVAQLAAAFLVHAERYYRDAEGRVSRGVVNYRLALRPLLELHRDTPTDRFSVRDLGAVRQLLIETEFVRKDKDGNPIPGSGRRRCRNYVNQVVQRIRSVFRWGAEQKLIPGSVWHELAALRGLPVGRAGVRESDPVEAVPRAAVDAVLPHLPTPLRAAVELQWLSGMRAGEVLQLRAGDIERGDKHWVFRPREHKGRWRGKERVVALGPKAQDVLRPLLKADPRAFLISPRDAMRERWAERHAARKSKVPPSQQARAERNAQRDPSIGERYAVAAYRRAIARACEIAGVERWSPHRLRHAAGTRLVLEAGVEQARATLGHSDDRMTRRYAKAAEEQLAAAAMAKHG